jgi:hypothetical protein
VVPGPCSPPPKLPAKYKYVPVPAGLAVEPDDDETVDAEEVIEEAVLIEALHTALARTANDNLRTANDNLQLVAVPTNAAVLAQAAREAQQAQQQLMDAQEYARVARALFADARAEAAESNHISAKQEAFIRSFKVSESTIRTLKSLPNSKLLATGMINDLLTDQAAAISAAQAINGGAAKAPM